MFISVSPPYHALPIPGVAEIQSCCDSLHHIIPCYLFGIDGESDGRHLRIFKGVLLIINSFQLPDHFFKRHAVEADRSEEHTSELQSRGHLVCRLLLEKKNYHVLCDL